MGLVGADGVAGDDVPDLDGFVVAGGGDEAAIWRPGDAVHAAEGVLVEKACFGGDGVPDAHGFVIAGGGDTPAVGGPGDSGDFEGVAAVDVDAAMREEERGEEAAAGVFCPFPDLDGAIVAGRGDLLAVG